MNIHYDIIYPSGYSREYNLNVPRILWIRKLSEYSVGLFMEIPTNIQRILRGPSLLGRKVIMVILFIFNFHKKLFTVSEKRNRPEKYLELNIVPPFN